MRFPSRSPAGHETAGLWTMTDVELGCSFGCGSLARSRTAPGWRSSASPRPRPEGQGRTPHRRWLATSPCLVEVASRLAAPLAAAAGGPAPAAAQRGAHPEEHRLTRESPIADRFTRAVEQLGSDALYVRLGGIYARDAHDLAAARRGAVVTHPRAAQRVRRGRHQPGQRPATVAGMSTGTADKATTSRA